MNKYELEIELKKLEIEELEKQDFYSKFNKISWEELRNLPENKERWITNGAVWSRHVERFIKAEDGKIYIGGYENNDRWSYEEDEDIWIKNK